MGTASLVFGLILIGIGLFFGLGFFYVIVVYPEILNNLVWALLVSIVFTIPFLVVGGLLLRKYDRDRKKEKAQG